MNKFSGKNFEQDARAMLDDVHGAVARIVEERSALDDAGATDQPLYILVGEIHNMSAHLIFHSLLLKYLQAYEDNIVVGIEGPHNFLKLDSQAELNRHDMRSFGLASIEKALTKSAGVDADLANKFFYRSLLNSAQVNPNFSAMFNDMATKNTCLDFADTATKDATVHFSDADVLDNDVMATSPMGIFLRNAFMASVLQNFAQTQNARIAVQFCGAGHLAGNYESWQNEHSLSAYFHHLNLPFLSVFLQDGQDQPYADQLTDEFKYFARNVPTYVTYYNPETGQVDLGNKHERRMYRRHMPEIKSRDEELAFINATLEAMGLPEDTISIQPKMA